MNTEDLARALRSGDFAAANPLAAAYGRGIMAELGAAATSESREAIARPALEFLNDQLHLVRVLRAHLASRLRANVAPCGYQTAEPDKHCWRFEG
jgi:hypothetical protein